MKKHLLNLMPFVFYASATMAQPVLTEANTQIVAGDFFDIRTTDYVSPGNAGANQTWDLSGLSITSTKAKTIVQSSTTPNASLFPSSNLALDESVNPWTSITYFNASSAGLARIGNDFGGGDFLLLSNAEDLLHFPMGFNDTFTDTWSGTTSGNPINGTSTYLYDGYGTLILPNGTFTNVVRIEFVSTFTVNSDVLNTLEYYWYLPGNHYPVAKISSFEFVGTPPYLAGEYLANITTGINENVIDNSAFSVYPNPACIDIHLLINKNITGKAEISISDVTGRVFQTHLIDVVEINNKLVLNISDFESGTYLINLKTKDGIVVKKLIKL